MVVATFTHRDDRILLVLAISIMVGQYKHGEAKLGALGDTLVMETTLNVVLETQHCDVGVESQESGSSEYKLMIIQTVIFDCQSRFLRLFTRPGTFFSQGIMVLVR